jgi:hypothetical protein
MFREKLEEIMKCGTPSMPLHLKVAAWHVHRKRKREKLPFALDDSKKVLMPRQAPLKKFDPSGSLTVPAVRVALVPYRREYEHLIIQDRLDTSLDFKGSLKIHNYFHLISRQPTWGEVPLGCTGKVGSPASAHRLSSGAFI